MFAQSLDQIQGGKLSLFLSLK